MTIYRITGDQLSPVSRTTFQAQNLLERQDLQRLLKGQISVISPDTLVVSEEFGDWEDSRRRIDLLGIDKGANLVVIELKRTEDGGHMELQAIRYAAMISTLTFERLTTIYARFMRDNEIGGDAAERLLEFLDWSEPDEEQFGQEVKIVLTSAEFSKELTTSVMWLNDFGVDIRCVKLQPYANGDQTLLDVQTVIPIPEVADYQVRIREKKQRERESRSSSRDFTRFDLTIGDEKNANLSKRWLIFHVIKAVLDYGASPQNIKDIISWRANQLFKQFEGELNEEQLIVEIMKDDPGGSVPRHKRYFAREGEFFCYDGQTYALTNQWGIRTAEAVDALIEAYPQLEISYGEHGY